MLRRTFAAAVVVTWCLAIGGSGVSGQEPTEQPEDGQRVEAAGSGFALSFPSSWTTEVREHDPDADPDSSPALLIAYELTGQSCSVGRYPDSWNIDLDSIAAGVTGPVGGSGRERLALVREAVAGLDAVRTDWRHDEDAGISFSSGFDLDTPRGVFWLSCYGNEQPDDAWRSIADTFELTDVASGGWKTAPPTEPPIDLEEPDYTVSVRVVDPGTAPRRELRYAWTRGQSDSMVVEMWDASAMSTEAVKVPSERAIPVRVRLTMTVDEVEPDGTALIETVVVSAEVISPRAIDEDERLLQDDLQTLVGLRVIERLDAHGYLLGSRSMDLIADTSGLHPTRDLVRHNLEHLAIRLPPTPIGESGVWQEVVTETDEEALSGSTIFTKTLTSTEGSDVLRVVVNMSSEAAMQPITAMAWLPDADVAMAVRGEGSGLRHIDLSRVAQATSATKSVDAVIEAVQDGSGSSFHMQTRSALATVPDGWDNDGWPSLAPVVDIDIALADPVGGTSPPSMADAALGQQGPAVTEVTVLDQGAEPRRLLRYAWAEGQTEDVVMELRQGRRTLVDGQWTQWAGTPAIRFALTSIVSAVFDDGTYEVEVLYTGVSIPEGSARLSGLELEEMQSQLSSFVGTKQQMRMDDRGRVVATETSLPTDGAYGLLQSEQYDALSKDFVIPLPDEAVGEGARWEVHTRTSGGMGFVAEGTTNVTLDKFIDDARFRTLVEARMVAEPQPMNLEALPDLMEAQLEAWSSTVSATQTIDLTKVNPRASSSGLTDAAITVSMGDLERSERLQSSIETQVWPLEARAD